MSDRRCIVTKICKDSSELIRFVLSPTGVLTPDIKCNLPGRGCWVTANKNFVSQAIEKNLFSRAFKNKVIIPDALLDMIDKLLTISCLKTLSLLKKAGLVILGSTQIISLAKQGRLSLILHSREAAADGKRKINQAVYSYKHANQKSPIILSLFSNDEMILIFGRAIIMHLAVLKDLRTADIIKRIQYLSNYRDDSQKILKDDIRDTRET
ncbi:RNA-binding protein [Bartonella sp. DGB1]|uniref:RNA-binding protein n=1 Tax=Bartonella sp. DGB1 TaxID=3239807 RepID=UPI003523D6D0